MSLLTPISVEAPTKESLILKHVEQIKQTSRNVYTLLSNIQKNGIKMVWHHDEFTPQEIIDAMGPDIISVFQYHGALTDYIVLLSQLEGLSPNIALPPNAFEINPQTGKITVTTDPYVP